MRLKRESVVVVGSFVLGVSTPALADVAVAADAGASAASAASAADAAG